MDLQGSTSLNRVIGHGMIRATRLKGQNERAAFEPVTVDSINFRARSGRWDSLLIDGCLELAH
jgi:hypothetical protein